MGSEPLTKRSRRPLAKIFSSNKCRRSAARVRPHLRKAKRPGPARALPSFRTWRCSINKQATVALQIFLLQVIIKTTWVRVRVPRGLKDSRSKLIKIKTEQIRPKSSSLCEKHLAAIVINRILQDEVGHT